MDFALDCLTGFQLPSCFVCSTVTRRQDRVCSMCWREFRKRLQQERANVKILRHPQVPGIPVRYLFDWIPDRHPGLSKVLTGLKGGLSGLTWQKLAREFLDHHCGDLHLREACILPIPSKKSSPDHAELWGRTLGQLIQIPFLNPLDHTEIRDQKALSLQERQSIQFDLNDASTLGSQVVIVDDILTTGATTRAAISAIGRLARPPKTIEIWTLARRHRLAP